MKEGWKIVSIGDVAKVINGGTPSTSEPSYWDGDVQWLTPKDMGMLTDKYVSSGERTITQNGVNHSSAKILPKYSIILSSRAPIGYVAINTVPMATNQGCKGLILSEKVCCEYIYYFLRKSKDLLNDLGTGATFKELSGGKLAEIKIPLPSLTEQQRIVTLLDAAFAKIDALKANAEKNLQNAKDLFQAALKKELEPKEGWVRKVVGEIADVRLGKMLDKSKNKGNYYPYLRNVNVRWDDFDMTDLLEMRFETTELDKYAIKRGDVVMCEGGEPARCAIWEREDIEMRYQKALHRVRLGDKVINRFLMYTFMNYSFCGTLTPYISGATIKHLTGEKLKIIPISFPTISEQLLIITHLDALNNRCKQLQENYTKTIALCDDLKQALLTKAFNGEL